VITAVPALTPVTIPDKEPMVATAMLPLLQVPNGVASASVELAPTHIDAVPVIGEGKGLTDIVVVIAQPVLMV
jgi:hypothetical protein